MPKVKKYIPTSLEDHLLKLFEIRDQCTDRLLKIIKAGKTTKTGAYSDLMDRIDKQITRIEAKGETAIDTELVVRFVGLEEKIKDTDGNTDGNTA